MAWESHFHRPSAAPITAKSTRCRKSSRLTNVSRLSPTLHRFFNSPTSISFRYLTRLRSIDCLNCFKRAPTSRWRNNCAGHVAARWRRARITSFWIVARGLEFRPIVWIKYRCDRSFTYVSKLQTRYFIYEIRLNTWYGFITMRCNCMNITVIVVHVSRVIWTNDMKWACSPLSRAIK